MGDIRSKKVTAPANLIPLELHKFHKGGDERPFLADVDIICNGGFIPVHSCVLRAGSRLFNDFFSEVRGSQTHPIVIHLLDYSIDDVTAAVVCFYTGSCIATSPDQAEQIFEILDQLGVPDGAVIMSPASPEEARKKNFIRRYLDCEDDDDDDMLIEEGEEIPIEEAGELEDEPNETRRNPKVEQVTTSTTLAQTTPVPATSAPEIHPASSVCDKKSSVSVPREPTRGLQTRTSERNTAEDEREVEQSSVSKKQPDQLVKVHPSKIAKATKVTRDGVSGVKGPPGERNSRNQSKPSPPTEVPRTRTQAKSTTSSRKRKTPSESSGSEKGRVKRGRTSKPKGEEDDESEYDEQEEDASSNDEEEEDEEEESVESGSFIASSSSEAESLPGEARVTRRKNLRRRRSKKSESPPMKKKLRRQKKRIKYVDDEDEDDDDDDKGNADASEAAVTKTAKVEITSNRGKGVSSKRRESAEKAVPQEQLTSAADRSGMTSQGHEEDESEDGEEDLENLDPAEQITLRDLRIVLKRLTSEEIEARTKRPVRAGSRSSSTDGEQSSRSVRSSSITSETKEKQPVTSGQSSRSARSSSIASETKEKQPVTSGQSSRSARSSSIASETKEKQPVTSGQSSRSARSSSIASETKEKQPVTAGQSARPARFSSVASETKEKQPVRSGQSSRSARSSSIASETEEKQPVASAQDLGVKSRSSRRVTSRSSSLSDCAGNSDLPRANLHVPPANPRSSSAITPNVNTAAVVDNTGSSSKTVKKLTRQDISRTSGVWREAVLKCDSCKSAHSSFLDATKCLQNRKSYRCWICLGVFRESVKAYAEHCAECHPSGKPQYSRCPICDVLFEVNGMRNHIIQTHLAPVDGDNSAAAANESRIENEEESNWPIRIRDIQQLTEPDPEEGETAYTGSPFPENGSVGDSVGKTCAAFSQRGPQTLTDICRSSPNLTTGVRVEVSSSETQQGSHSSLTGNPPVVLGHVAAVVVAHDSNDKNVSRRAVGGTGLPQSGTVTRTTTSVTITPNAPSPSAVSNYRVQSPQTVSQNITESDASRSLPAAVPSQNIPNSGSTTVSQSNVPIPRQENSTDAQALAIADEIRRSVSQKHKRETQLDFGRTNQNVTVQSHGSLSAPVGVQQVHSNDLPVTSQARTVTAPTMQGLPSRKFTLSSGESLRPLQPSSPNVTNPESALVPFHPQNRAQPSQQQRMPSVGRGYSLNRVGESIAPQNSALTARPAFCGVTNIGGVPFKIFSRPAEIDPHPHAVASVTQNNSNGSRYVIRSPRTAGPRPLTHNLANSGSLNQANLISIQNFQSALRENEIIEEVPLPPSDYVQSQHPVQNPQNILQQNHPSRDTFSAPTGPGASQQVTQPQDIAAPSSIQNTYAGTANACNQIFRCDKCMQQFASNESLNSHLCFDDM